MYLLKELIDEIPDPPLYPLILSLEKQNPFL